MPRQEKVVPEEQDIKLYEKDRMTLVPEFDEALAYETSNIHEMRLIDVKKSL